MNKEFYLPIQFHFENIFSYEIEYFIYSCALLFLVNFVYNELLMKSSGNKKDDVISKLSFLEELYKNKLIDKDEYKIKLESLKKEASKSI